MTCEQTPEEFWEMLESMSYRERLFLAGIYLVGALSLLGVLIWGTVMVVSVL